MWSFNIYVRNCIKCFDKTYVTELFLNQELFLYQAAQTTERRILFCAVHSTTLYKAVFTLYYY